MTRDPTEDPHNSNPHMLLTKHIYETIIDESDNVEQQQNIRKKMTTIICFHHLAHAADTEIPKPCSNCAPTFGFKHVFDFNSDAELFERAVSEQLVSGNLDTPEGGFDALLQVAVCEDAIKWEPVGECNNLTIPRIHGIQEGIV